MPKLQRFLISLALFLGPFSHAAVNRQEALQILRSDDSVRLKAFFRDELEAYHFLFRKKKVTPFLKQLSPAELATFSAEALELFAQYSDERRYFRFDGEHFAFESLSWDKAALKRLSVSAVNGTALKYLDALEWNRQIVVTERYLRSSGASALAKFGAREARWAGLMLLALNSGLAYWEPALAIALMGPSAAVGVFSYMRWVRDPDRLLRERARLLQGLAQVEKYAIDQGMTLRPDLRQDIQNAKAGDEVLLAAIRADGLEHLLTEDPEDGLQLLGLSESDARRAHDLVADSALSGLPEEDESFLDFRSADRADSLWVYVGGQEKRHEGYVEGHASQAGIVNRGALGSLISSRELDRLSDGYVWIRVPEIDETRFFLLRLQGKKPPLPEKLDIEIWDRPYAETGRKIITLPGNTGSTPLATRRGCETLSAPHS